MSEPLDWNAKTIAEFRANEGRVGGVFEGAPLVLVHHRGRTSGREYVNPVMYLPHDTEPDVIYVFATKGGAPDNPDWYRNLAAAGDATICTGALPSFAFWKWNFALSGSKPRCGRPAR